MNNLAKKRTLENRVLIDYFTVTIDDFEIEKSIHGNYYIQNMEFFEELLSILGHKTGYLGLKRDRALSGFKEGYRIGEFIRISYGGILSHGKEVLMLTLTGQACREFENNLNGDWLELLDFVFFRCVSKRVTALHLAYDDFNSQFFSLYDLTSFIKTGSWSGQSRVWSIIESGERKDNGNLARGLTLYIGTSGSNQLVFYNKKLERYYAKQYDLDVEIWNRYEIQFAGEMAENVAIEYYDKSLNNNSSEFMEFYFELLFKMFDPKDLNSKRKRVRERETWKPWLDFINFGKKSNIKTKHRVDPSLTKKLLWHDYAITTTHLEFGLALGLKDMEKFLYQKMLDKIDDFEDKNGKLERVNNYLDDKKEKKKTTSDIEKLKEEIKKKIESYG